MKVYDCIVIGVGGIGSGALWEAAKRKWSVLGIEQFGAAHNRGSSHGQTRIIRRAYFEHPNYVPLVERSFELWDELTKRHRTAPEVKPLLIPSGLLQVGHPESELIQGIQASAKRFDLPIETFTPAEIEERLPIFRIPNDHVGLYESNAGILCVERCVAAMIQQALKQGAEMMAETNVTHWDADSSGVFTVYTDRGSFSTERLVIAGGAWSQRLLPTLNQSLTVLRKQQHWFQIDRTEQKLINRFPVFLFEQSNGDIFYGVPEIDYLGMKVCQHNGGEVVTDPATLSHELDASELQRTEQFMQNHFRYTHHRLVHHSNCMYTMSADSHFIIDQHPDQERLSFAAGMSGHGFKFAPLIGKYLIELLVGAQDPLFEFLKIR